MKIKPIIISLLVLACFSLYASQDAYTIIKRLPKAELHIHLGGAYPLSYLRTIATPEQFAALQMGLDKVADKVEYQNIFSAFGLVSQIVNSEQKVEDGTYALCKELQADSVEYVEIRTGLKNMGNGYQSYLEAVLRGIERAMCANFRACVILSLQRNATMAYAQATIDLARAYKDRGIVGIDISGDSAIGDIRPILPIVLQAKTAGLKILVHIGESQFETDQMLLLETLQPDRVGHAVHLCDEAYQWIIAHKIPVEVCLTSAELTMMIDHHTMHPWIAYYRKGHPIIIGTDDPLLFRTNLTNEYMLLYDAGLLTLEEIANLTHN
ncbi:MAG: adenosine deaminase [Candidatus Babeliales bacterium]